MVPTAATTFSTPPDAPSLSELWLLWQLADSAFPIGGFAHSAGVEAAWQHGCLPSAEALETFARQSLTQTLHAAAPFFLAAYDHPENPDDFDALLDSTLSNHVANRASRAQGQALLATADKSFSLPALSQWRARILKHAHPAHFPIVAGVVLQALGISRNNASRLFLFLACRGILSAAVRLGAVGPIQAQQIQSRLAPHLDACAAAAEHLALDDAAQTSPLLDILQSTQDRLYSRLFQS